MDFDEQVLRWAEQRALTWSDKAIVATVVGLVKQIREARQAVQAEGLTVMGAPHPAIEIQNKCSAELRGWVRTRPDLFAEEQAPKDDGLRVFNPKIVG